MLRYNELKDILLQRIEESQKDDLNTNIEVVPFYIIPNYPEYVSQINYLLGGNNFYKLVGYTTEDWNKIRSTITQHNIVGKQKEKAVYKFFCKITNLKKL